MELFIHNTINNILCKKLLILPPNSNLITQIINAVGVDNICYLPPGTKRSANLVLELEQKKLLILDSNQTWLAKEIINCDLEGNFTQNTKIFAGNILLISANNNDYGLIRRSAFKN